MTFSGLRGETSTPEPCSGARTEARTLPSTSFGWQFSPTCNLPSFQTSTGEMDADRDLCWFLAYIKAGVNAENYFPSLVTTWDITFLLQGHICPKCLTQMYLRTSFCKP